MKKWLLTVLLIIGLTACNNQQDEITEAAVRRATEMIALNEFQMYTKEELSEVFADSLTKDFLETYMPVFQEQSVRDEQFTGDPPVVTITKIEQQDKDYEVSFTYDFMPDVEVTLLLKTQGDRIASYNSCD